MKLQDIYHEKNDILYGIIYVLPIFYNKYVF